MPWSQDEVTLRHLQTGEREEWNAFFSGGTQLRHHKGGETGERRGVDRDPHSFRFVASGPDAGPVAGKPKFGATVQRGRIASARWTRRAPSYLNRDFACFGAVWQVQERGGRRADRWILRCRP